MRKKKALYNFVTSVALQIASIVCGLIVPRLIISTYGSDINGLINSITQFLAYITLLESGFGPVILSALYKPIADNDKLKVEKLLKFTESFFRKISYIFLIYIILLCFIYPHIINSDYDNIFTVSLIIIISLSTFSEYFFGLTNSIYLQADQKKYVISIIRFITTIINTLIICLLVKLNFSIIIVKLSTALIYASRPIVLSLYVKKKCQIDLSKVKEKEKIKERWDGLSQHIAGTIYSNTDVTLLSLFSKMSEVSVYSVYNLVLTSVKNFVSILTDSVQAGFGDMIAKDETTNLNNKFNIYEFLYFTTITVVYSCTAVLIVKFVNIYTRGITDANYVRTIFSLILVSAVFVHAVKSIYNSLAFTAGKFKETHKGSWVEAFSNLLISFCLVFKYGIVGVAIGSLVSVLIRCFEFMIFTSKKILKRDLKKTFINVFLCFFQYISIYLICNNIINFNVTSYFDWFLSAIVVGLISVFIVVPLNIIFYKNEFRIIFSFIHNKIRKVK